MLKTNCTQYILSSLVCFAYFTFAFLDCVRLYKEDFVKSSLRYIEVLVHTLDCNFGGAEENR